MNVLKKISLILLILMISISICTNVRANSADDGGEDLSDASGSSSSNFDLNAFDNPDKEKGLESADKMLNKAAASVISIARIVCVTIAIVILLVIAMKYMISAPGDRADIKKHAVNYVIGSFVLFGVSGILTILNNVAQSIGS